MKRLFTLRKDLYEKEQEMLKYALCMIEMSTSSSFKWSERYICSDGDFGLYEKSSIIDQMFFCLYVLLRNT